MYLVTCDFQAISLACRSFQDSPAHQDAALRARSTAWSTSASPKTGKVSMTSDVAGFSVSKVAAGAACPWVHVATIAPHPPSCAVPTVSARHAAVACR